MDSRRRELVREYKEAPRTAGVGIVRNTKNGKVLVVAGTDLPALLNRHRAQLRLNGHRHAELQGDWHTYGADAFTFEVLDTLTPPRDATGWDPAEELATLEALWLEKLQPYGTQGYNRPKSG